uniref:Uncharacterized protein n=1 Tax=Arundo donax TaxID=35708 RepID=A0A0A9HKU8_ARUDO
MSKCYTAITYTALPSAAKLIINVLTSFTEY